MFHEYIVSAEVFQIDKYCKAGEASGIQYLLIRVYLEKKSLMTWQYHKEGMRCFQKGLNADQLYSGRPQ